jgi:hypothetical protein
MMHLALCILAWEAVLVATFAIIGMVAQAMDA